MKAFDKIAATSGDAEDAAVYGIDLNFGVVVEGAHFKDAFARSEVDAVDGGQVGEIGVL